MKRYLIVKIRRDLDEYRDNLVLLESSPAEVVELSDEEYRSMYALSRYDNSYMALEVVDPVEIKSRLANHVKKAQEAAKKIAADYESQKKKRIANAKDRKKKAIERAKRLLAEAGLA